MVAFQSVEFYLSILPIDKPRQNLWISKKTFFDDFEGKLQNGFEQGKIC